MFENGHMAPEHISPGLGHQLMTHGTISLGLVPQPPSPTPDVPPTKNDWDSVFCPMFDEYFNPSPSVAQPVLVAVVQEPVVSTGTPSSTRIDHDTPYIHDVSNDEEYKTEAVVAEKQAGYVQTNLTLSSAELEIQSMTFHEELLRGVLERVVGARTNSDGQKDVLVAYDLIHT
ncbi:hypothetical protein Tco_1144068 [Tanacetum coccineum]